jgi:hypothetical protein
VASAQFTLHRRAWRGYRRLPRLARVWIVLAVLGALVKVLLLSGASEADGVRAAVAAAVREATGPNPASSCAALSPAGLSQLVSQFGGGEAGNPLLACQRLVLQLRSQATPEQVTEFARGGVRSVQFRSGGSALVIYGAAGGHLAAELTLSQSGGRWLIDSVDSGTIAGGE